MSAPNPVLKPIDECVFKALARKSAHYSLYIVYRFLTLSDFRDAAVVSEILNLDERTVRRNYAVLKKLGLLRKRKPNEVGPDLIVATHSGDGKIERALDQIRLGKVSIDIRSGRVTVEATGREVDATDEPLETYEVRGYNPASGAITPRAGLQPHPAAENTDSVSLQAATTSELSCQNGSAENCQNGEDAQNIGKSSYINKSRNTKRPSISTRINKLLTEEFYTKDAMPLSDKHNLPIRGFKPEKDPYRSDVEAVQAHANQVLGTRHTVYGAEGKINERYGIILRALHHFGYSRADLERAIDTVPKHHYWGKSGVKDLIKLFRKEANIGELVNYTRPTNLKPDIRHLEMRANYDPNKVVTCEEF